MSTFRQLCSEHRTLLVLDASSSNVQAGWLTADGDRWASVTAEAGIGVFRAVEQLGIEVRAVGAFVLCDGPGSILGVRTAAAAIRTWCVLEPKPVFAYHGLEALAAALGDPGLTLIADARRGTWHCAGLGRPLARIATAELPDRIAMPAGFRTWSALPGAVTIVPYALGQIIPRVLDADLCRPADAPDAFLHEEPAYVQWTPKIHRAP